MNAYSEKPEPLNWDHYKRNISKLNFVEDFKKQFEAVSVPYPKDMATADIEADKIKMVSNNILTGTSLHTTPPQGSWSEESCGGC